ncbi:UNVERIFIED_CONTAM: hypothetical protein Sindi_3131200 [Sesamum indicum]
MTASFSELKSKWESRFGKEAVMRCFSITAPVLPKPRRQVWRNLLPSSLSVADSMENRTGMKVDNQSSRSSISGKIVNNVLPKRIGKTPEFADEHDTTSDADADITADLCDDVSNDTSAYATADVMHDISNAMDKISTLPTQERSFPTGLFVGNIPLNTHSNMSIDDKIADAFNNSSRKTLSYIPPIIQNGEVVVRPTMETIRNGSTKWKTTAEIKAITNGFFFFQFKTVAYMEEAIAGGPWLFQGQSIAMQKWEPGMVMRKLKHTQVPIWIKLRHLLVELWTEEGLSIVASGIGKPLYPDAITTACTRLDFARVRVMLDVSSKLTKHIIIMTPDEEGGETPCKIDVEYEWIPPKCTNCMTLRHSVKDYALNKPSKPIIPPVTVYVPIPGVVRPPPVPDQETIPPE